MQLWFRMRYWTWMPLWEGYCFNWRASWRCLPTYIWSGRWPLYGGLVTSLWYRAWMSRESIMEWIFYRHMPITKTKIRRMERFCDALRWKFEWKRSPTLLVWLWRDTNTIWDYLTWWNRSLTDIRNPSMGSESNWWKWDWAFDRWHAGLYSRKVSNRPTSRNYTTLLMIPMKIP